MAPDLTQIPIVLVTLILLHILALSFLTNSTCTTFQVSTSTTYMTSLTEQLLQNFKNYVILHLELRSLVQHPFILFCSKCKLVCNYISFLSMNDNKMNLSTKGDIHLIYNMYSVEIKHVCSTNISTHATKRQRIYPLKILSEKGSNNMYERTFHCDALLKFHRHWNQSLPEKHKYIFILLLPKMFHYGI